mgnify:CR=1 FL=1
MWQRRVGLLKAKEHATGVTFNPSKASPEETKYIIVPKLDEDVVLVLGTIALRFDLIVTGQADSYVVDNVSWALLSR